MPPIESPVDVMVPLLVMVVVPDAALFTPIARPLMLVKLSPRSIPVPRIIAPV